MEVINESTYTNFLLQLLNKNYNIDSEEHKKFLELNVYLTLLALSNFKYDESFYEKEINIIENFLRKVNNFKVKIQLKRKENEIDNLLNEINDIYIKNKELITKYNKENLDIDGILFSKNTVSLTNMIDKLTKLKMKKQENKENNDNLRNKVSEIIFLNNYYIYDEFLYIENIDYDELLKISLEDFYEIFEYLLNIDTYQSVYSNNNSEESHKKVIKSIIKALLSKDSIDDEIIPIALTYIITRNIPDYNEIDTSGFSIDNIKITDLYSFAEKNNIIDNSKTARWKNILIPNEYLYDKIKEIAIKGMYYFKDDKFIIENIDNSISDFKISIDIDKMLEFLKQNLENLSKIDSYKKA